MAASTSTNPGVTSTFTSTPHPSPLPPWKAHFLKSILSSHVLHFGTFTLKSGRISPYFFNAGLLHRASLLHSIAEAYAQTILAHDTPSPLSFDLLFGPAYKGIPLSISTLLSLRAHDPARFERLEYSFNRKEAKTHGEGGSIVGASLRGKRVVIIDDVITAGTAIREAISIIEAEGGIVVGIVVALDRGERLGEGPGEGGSALGGVRRMLGGNVPVMAVLTLTEVIDGLKAGVGIGSPEDVAALEAYQLRWKALD